MMLAVISLPTGLYVLIVNFGLPERKNTAWVLNKWRQKIRANGKLVYLGNGLTRLVGVCEHL